jgi:sigma-B regulation protein RsbU (phosphoserine phosphatase)
MMKVLVADDDLSMRRLLSALLERWGFDTIAVSDGNAAWEALEQNPGLQLAILDWQMPGPDGPEICTRLRMPEVGSSAYVILLTVMDREEDIIKGLESGANDYITKPFKPAELRARIRVGERVVRLQSALKEQVGGLRQALDHIKTLKSVLPVCAKCRKVRNEEAVWQKFQDYMVTHWQEAEEEALCADCLKNEAENRK